MSKNRPSKEELTTKMHSEFTVTTETDTSHKAFSAIRTMQTLNYSIDKAAKLYDITVTDIQENKERYNALNQ